MLTTIPQAIPKLYKAKFYKRWDELNEGSHVSNLAVVEVFLNL